MALFTLNTPLKDATIRFSPVVLPPAAALTLTFREPPTTLVSVKPVMFNWSAPAAAGAVTFGPVSRTGAMRRPVKFRSSSIVRLALLRVRLRAEELPVSVKDRLS